MRPELVTQCVDQRMQATTAGAGVVHTPAGICASIRTRVDTATPSCAAVAAGDVPVWNGGLQQWVFIGH